MPILLLQKKNILVTVLMCFLLQSVKVHSQELWNSQESGIYNFDGSLRGKIKSYFNDGGRKIQEQTIESGESRIWMKQVLFDKKGRSALKTLRAPIDQTKFQFYPGFIKTESGSNYDYDNFDGPSETAAPVGDFSNTIGWYYSESNTSEPYQDVTEYPFVRSMYSEIFPGKVKKTIGGNKQGGNWNGSYSFDMPASKELAQSVAFNNSQYSNKKIIKTVVRNANGIENVLFKDLEGNLLAVAKSGGENVRSMQINIPAQGFIDVHIPRGETAQGILISNPGSNSYEIYDLISETVSAVSPSNLSSGFYRIAVSDLNNYDSYNSPITVTYKENYYDYSLSYFNEAGMIIESTQGNKNLSTTYKYNSLGQLTESSNPDLGTSKFKYNSRGQIRFSQNSYQEGLGEFSYTNYDEQGRPVETGVLINNNFATLNADGQLPSGTNKEQVFTTYDLPDENLSSELSNYNITALEYQNQSFVSGKVSTTQTSNTNNTWYSYDIYGRITWIIQKIEGLGIKTINYDYDSITAKVSKVVYQKHVPSEMFIHRYSYNSERELVKVETSTDDINYKEQVSYSYYDSGQLKRKVLGENLQGVDYVYNLSGDLKSINGLKQGEDPGNDTNDVFGMSLDYFENDYKRQNTPVEISSGENLPMNSYNDDIKRFSWNNSESLADEPVKYEYTYDRNKWLTEANFSYSLAALLADLSLDSVVAETNPSYRATNSVTLNPGFQFSATSNNSLSVKIEEGESTGDYKVSGISYDKNGNILQLSRNKQTENDSNEMDKLTYNYLPGGNKLGYVSDAVTSETNAQDIKSQSTGNYVYNDIGQLISNSQEDLEFEYTTAGMIKRVNKAGALFLEFEYNERGQRISKKVYNSGALMQTTYFVKDLFGNTIAVYEDQNLSELNLYGNQRIGSYNKQLDAEFYEIKDHLGNVRSVIAKTGETALEIKAKTDYYPFGMEMPGREVVGQYRYGFQGQEKLEEINLDAFNLRLWDARLGRWVSVDPYSQYFSPYLGMGNSPIVLIDPSGGSTCKEKPCVENLPEIFIYAYAKTLPSDFFNNNMTAAQRQLEYLLYKQRGDNWFKGFAANFDAGWESWDEDGLGNQLMNFSAIVIGGSLLSATLAPAMASDAVAAAPHMIEKRLMVGFGKSVASAVGQYAANQKINVIGAVADGYLVPGIGDLVGSSLDISVTQNTIEVNSVFNGKSINQIAGEAAIGTIFSFKMHGIEKTLGEANSDILPLIFAPNQAANYSLQSLVNE